MVAMGETEITKVYADVDGFEDRKPSKGGCDEGHPHRMLPHQFSKDTLDIPDPAENQNSPLKSCILISKEDGSGERISIKKAKSVHFADTLGKPLKSVRTLVDPFDDAFELGILRLRSSSRRSFPANIFQQSKREHPPKEEVRYECEFLNFKQPGESKDFLTHLFTQNVCLQNISYRDFGIFGTIVVKNISYDKEVSVVYTMDGWRSQTTLKANYVSAASMEKADLFSFKITPKLEDGMREVPIIFAICYKVNGMSYWDSNYGNNYSVLLRQNFDSSGKASLYENRNGFILQKQPFVGWSM